jgi:hypothetical protein
MKAAIIYHTHYGNTAYIVRLFREAFSGRITTESFELTYEGGKKNIILRAIYRFVPSLVKLSPVAFDLKEYDIIFFGIAVMGGHPSSAMAKYLNLCKNVANKKIVCCYVYSIEASMKTCRGYVEEILKAKGAQSFINLDIPWSQVLNKQLLDSLIAGTIAKLNI